MPFITSKFSYAVKLPDSDTVFVPGVPTSVSDVLFAQLVNDPNFYAPAPAQAAPVAVADPVPAPEQDAPAIESDDAPLVPDEPLGN